jgi:acetyltransferase-like isoleucine patch superfamily enzyme
MNINYLLKKIMLRPTCVLGRKAKLFNCARILNGRGDSNSIIIGDNSAIKGELFTFGHGGEISIGSWCYIGEGSKIWSGRKIKIGDRTLISHGVNIFDNLTHPIDSIDRHRQFRDIMTKGHPRNINLGDLPIIIEDDVLIGANAIILRGVHIGRRSIIGAGSVISKNIPEGVIVVGNPGRVIRRIDESPQKNDDTSSVI